MEARRKSFLVAAFRSLVPDFIASVDPKVNQDFFDKVNKAKEKNFGGKKVKAERESSFLNFRGLTCYSSFFIHLLLPLLSLLL